MLGKNQFVAHLNKLGYGALHVPKAYVAPRDSDEEAVAEIWARALKVRQVGIHDNYFELGGHSLLAAQIMFRVRETFEV